MLGVYFGVQFNLTPQTRAQNDTATTIANHARSHLVFEPASPALVSQQTPRTACTSGLYQHVWAAYQAMVVLRKALRSECIHAGRYSARPGWLTSCCKPVVILRSVYSSSSSSSRDNHLTFPIRSTSTSPQPHLYNNTTNRPRPVHHQNGFFHDSSTGSRLVVTVARFVKLAAHADRCTGIL